MNIDEHREAAAKKRVEEIAQMRGKQEENKLKEAVLPLLQDQYFQLQNDLEEMEERLSKKISAAGNQEYYFKELKFLIWVLSIAFILMLAIVLYRQ